MTEHPMITAMDIAIGNSERVPDFTRNSAVAALQWMANPTTMSAYIVGEVARQMQKSVFYNPAEDAERVIIALANALIKEIEGHEKGGAS